MPRRGRVRAAAHWLGLLDDGPRPTLRQSLLAGLQVLPVVLVAAVVAALVDGAGGPRWLVLMVVVSPVWLLTALLRRRAGD